MSTEQKLADAIRDVTASVQRAIDHGDRSRRIDADDLVDVLLSIADRLDPPLARTVEPAAACPSCGERNADRLVWQEEDETVQCAGCGTTYRPRE
jgi:hypothetical protein